MAETTLKEAAWQWAEQNGRPVEVVHHSSCGPRNAREVCTDCLAEVAEFWRIYDQEEARRGRVANR